MLVKPIFLVIHSRTDVDFFYKDQESTASRDEHILIPKYPLHTLNIQH